MSDDDEREVMLLGRELQRSGRTGDPIGLPTSVLNQHLLIAGSTGAGKSTTATTAIRSGQEAIDGATIVIDPKGDDWPAEVARTLYERDGDLERLLYIDSNAVLPAFAPFDIRPALQAGQDRSRAVMAVSDGVAQLIQQVRLDDSRSIRSMQTLKNIVTALYDPVHGSNAITISEIMTAIETVQHDDRHLETSVDWTTAVLESLRETPAGQLQSILGGVRSRIEKLYASDYLRPVFEHAPGESADAFRFDDWLDENVVMVIDLGALTDTGQRVLATLILSELWQALQRRKARQRGDPDQVLLFIDEVANLGIESQLSTLLAEGRGFGLGVVPMVQFPNQLRDTRANDELLNNIHSLLIGRIPDDSALARRLATEWFPKRDIMDTLSLLEDQRWLFKPAMPRHKRPVDPFMIAEAPLPPGHPEQPDPDKQVERAAFREAFETCRQRTNDAHGLEYDDYTAPAVPPARQTDDAIVSALKTAGFETTLPLAAGLPEQVHYDDSNAILTCTTCEATYPPTADGLVAALTCHAAAEAIDREPLPPVALDPALDPTTIDRLPVSVREFCTLQVCHRVARFETDSRLLDPVHDPLGPGLETLGVTDTMLTRLAEEGYLTRDAVGRYDFPTVTADGRELLGQAHTHGDTWGPGEGDLTESLLHRVMVEAVARYIEHEYATADGPITRVESYHEPEHPDLPANTRFDVVGRDETGTIRIIGEAECANNDAAVAARRDYDAIATIAPDEAIWAVPSNGRGHEAVLQPLGTPTAADIEDPAPRIREYSDTTRITQMSGPSEPGITQLHTLNDLRKALPEPSVQSPATASGDH